MNTEAIENFNTAERKSRFTRSETRAIKAKLKLSKRKSKSFYSGLGSKPESKAIGGGKMRLRLLNYRFVIWQAKRNTKLSRKVSRLPLQKAIPRGGFHFPSINPQELKLGMAKPASFPFKFLLCSPLSPRSKFAASFPPHLRLRKSFGRKTFSSRCSVAKQIPIEVITFGKPHQLMSLSYLMQKPPKLRSMFRLKFTRWGRIRCSLMSPSSFVRLRCVFPFECLESQFRFVRST